MSGVPVKHHQGVCVEPGRVCAEGAPSESRSGEHEVWLGDTREKEARPGPTHPPLTGAPPAPGTLTRDGRGFPDLLPEGWKGAS